MLCFFARNLCFFCNEAKDALPYFTSTNISSNSLEAIKSKYPFNINTKKEVESFYNLALKLGATDEGLPGPRHEQDYYAYFRDLDGNKICAFSSD